MNGAGLYGRIRTYEVVVLGDMIAVLVNGSPIAGKTVAGLARFISSRTVKLGWTRTADFEIVHLYDPQDGNFGYALNVTAPDLSEWGYSYFGTNHEEVSP